VNSYGDIEISEDREDNRLRIRFPGKPSADCIKVLKSNGFRWAPSVGCWSRQLNEASWYHARVIVARENERDPELRPSGFAPDSVETAELAKPPEDRRCTCVTPRPRFSAAELAGELPGQIGKPAQVCDDCGRLVS
jgi:hypothetical protein